MDRLSACYFCGVATVGDRGRVRVAGAETATVALCGDCADKLDRLATAAGVELSVETDDQATETGPSAPPDAADADQSPDDVSGIPEDAQIFTDDTPLDDPTAGGHDPAETTEEPTTDADTGGSSTADAGDSTRGRSFATSQAAGGRRETSHDPRGPDADGRPQSGDDGGGDTTPADVDVATVPRETYNKVVRLLQNRSFPVERDTVVSVATSAYGLSRRDCEATIDALVEHGVLEESEDGRRLFRT